MHQALMIVHLLQNCYSASVVILISQALHIHCDNVPAFGVEISVQIWVADGGTDDNCNDRSAGVSVIRITVQRQS